MTQLDLLVSGGGSPFDQIRRIRTDGSEYWSARELMPLLGYERWESFADAIERAKVACGVAGQSVEQNFREVTKVTGMRGPASQDFELSRFACYLVAMNGDPRKSEIAAAQAYFAIKTREAEVSPALTRREILTMALEAEDRAERAETLAEERRVPALEWDKFLSTDGDYSCRQAAFILSRDPGISTGQNRLMRWLRENHVIDRRNRPYQAHGAHVRLRATYYEHPHTHEQVAAEPQVRITISGLSYLHKRLGGVRGLDLGPVGIPE